MGHLRFVLLACGASLDIFFCETSQFFSLIGLVKKVYSVSDAWVSC